MPKFDDCLARSQKHGGRVEVIFGVCFKTSLLFPLLWYYEFFLRNSLFKLVTCSHLGNRVDRESVREIDVDYKLKLTLHCASSTVQALGLFFNRDNYRKTVNIFSVL